MERQAKDGTIYKQVAQDEWAPVTRLAKDGTVFTKVGQDEWRPAGSKNSGPQVSKLESGVRGATQGATLGFADEISGGAEALWEKAKGNPEEFGKLYGQYRDESRKNFKSAEEANPGTYMSGEIAGAVGTAFIPGMAAARGAKLAQVVDKSARIGTIAGAGYSQGETARDVLKDATIGGAIGTALPVGVDKILKGAQRGVSSGAKEFVEKVAPTRLKLNESQIRAAADRLGIKVTPGMLDDAGFVQRLEYTLAESPSLLGQSVNRSRRDVTDKLGDSVTEITKDATSLTPYQVGEKFKSGVASRVGERLDPISTVFTEVAESTKSIQVPDRSKAAVARHIQAMDTFKLTGGAGKPQQYVDMIGRLENADQVKTMMTLLNQDISASSGAEKSVLIGIKEKLSNLESNSITRAAIQTARESGMKPSTGKQIGSQIVQDLKDARSEYRTLVEDLKGFSESARLKANKGPSAFLDAVENIPSERVQDKFFNVENNRQLSALRDKFPEEFELLRQGKLKEIADAAFDSVSGGRGEISPSRFLREVNKLNPESKQMIFARNASMLDDIQTVQNSLPKNFNPSGSGTQAGWQDTIYRNLKDIPTYLQYRAASSNMGRRINEKIAKVPDLPKLNEGYRRISDKVNRPAIEMNLPKSEKVMQLAEDEKPPKEKGPEKWASDGFDKLLKSATPAQAEKLKSMREELMKSPKGRKKLVSASDLSPNSKAMAQILKSLEGDI